MSRAVAECVEDFMPSHDTHYPPPGPDATGRSRSIRDVAVPIIVFLPLAWLVATASTERVAVPPDGADGANAATLATRVDPNRAPWWELTALPRIGDKTAQSIVAYREAHRAKYGQDAIAFRSAHDLTRVKGIGPKTVERLRPMLVFPTDADHVTARR
jgi:competence ComEA-like helix-hairpin-helix protein